MSSLRTITGRYLASYPPCTSPARSGIQGPRGWGVGAIAFALVISLMAAEIKAQSSPVGNIDGVSNSSCTPGGWAKDPDTRQLLEINGPGYLGNKSGSLDR